jgi:hypothetical protein
MEFKLLKDTSDSLTNIFCFETKPLVVSINLLTYINHDKVIIKVMGWRKYKLLFKDLHFIQSHNNKHN